MGDRCFASLMIPLVLVGSACEDTESGGMEQIVECEPSDDYLDYAPGLVVEGPAGVALTLIGSIPGPPEKGDNRWDLRVADVAGQPIVGATMEVLPSMPQHGHGTAVPADVVPGQNPGDYIAQPVHFSMAGVWEIAVQLDDAMGNPLDEMVFHLCIES